MFGGATSEGTGGRERAAEAFAGRRDARQRRIEGPRGKECMVRPVRARVRDIAYDKSSCINVSRFLASGLAARP